MSDNLMLGITKIGDLLLRNKITQDKEGDAIENIKLAIPNYQRPYKWTPKNVIQLLDDVLNAKNENKETYRVGTLILHQEGKSKFSIVDGQQRTITFSLLLLTLMQELELNVPLAFLNQKLSDNSFNTHNIPTNFSTLERRVKSIINKRDKKDLFDYVENNCELIVVVTNDISEAFQFFDSQNARGKKLYPHDLLKAYHLREMNNLKATEIEEVVKIWENLEQNELSSLFNNYLYRVKEWAIGNRAEELTEHNIYKFKGITRQDNFPFAQFYKGAYSYADMVNHSAMPFVSGIQNLKPFQLDTPIVAGRPFFDYAKHYFDILKDIQNNDKYEGYYIHDNEIIRTLDLGKYKNGVGNRITRLLFDTAVLLYVDRFCPVKPSKVDQEMLDQFLTFAFVWAYSLRAQYYNLGWQSAQNYIMKNIKDDAVVNSFNIYKVITEADSPVSLFGNLSEKVLPLPFDNIVAKKDIIDEKDNDGIYQNYLHYFKVKQFLRFQNENAAT